MQPVAGTVAGAQALTNPKTYGAIGFDVESSPAPAPSAAPAALSAMDLGSSAPFLLEVPALLLQAEFLLPPRV